MLSDYLTPQVIRLKVNVNNWQEAVRAGGELLLKAGKCQPSYIEAMIRAVQELGAYMVLAPGLALAHARPEDGALQVGLSLVTLDNGINFGSEANDPVKMVISFCAPDHHSHIEMLQSLAEFLMSEDNQNLLKPLNRLKRFCRLLVDFLWRGV